MTIAQLRPTGTAPGQSASALDLVPAISERQFGIFTTEQAQACGITADRLERAARAGHLQRVRRGVYCPPDVLQIRERGDEARVLAARAVAATLTISAAIASHHGAAAIAGLPIYGAADSPCVTVLPGFDSRTPGAHLHRASLLGQDRRRFGALKVTSVPRTVCDVARESGIVPGVVLADAAMRQGQMTPQTLHSFAERFGHWPGGHNLRDVVAPSNGLSESVLESVSRLAIVRKGLPLPELQVPITDSSGQIFARPDFLWRKFRVIGEADGALKYAGGSYAPLYEEKVRQERLEALGYVVIRWGWASLQDFGPVAHRLRVAFTAAEGSGRLAV